MDIVTHPLKRLYNRTSNLANHQYGEPLLAVLFFVEAIIYMPADPLLVIYCAQRPEKAQRYATIATCASILGGILSYTIGFFLWKQWGNAIINNKIVNYIVTPATFDTLCTLYQKHQYLALLIAGVLPIPYKATTLTAGFCRISLTSFIICTACARGLRFFGLSYIIQRYGERIKNYIDHSFTFLVVLKIVAVVYVIWLVFR